ncbi:MAG: hypothetical protein M4D80_41290 [Myxococcota bacterium]|nr:hypothetical protein [Myxococcota bacterium]
MVLDPTKHEVFRGGLSLTIRPNVDVHPSRADKLIHPTKKGNVDGKFQGPSTNIDPLDKFVVGNGGAHRVLSVPEGLQIVRDGDKGHFVIAPTRPMTMEAYEALMAKVELDQNLTHE